MARIAGDYAKWNKSGKEKYSMIPLHMESKITQHSQIKSQNHLRAFHLHIEQTSGYQWGQVRGGRYMGWKSEIGTLRYKISCKDVVYNMGYIANILY